MEITPKQQRAIYAVFTLLFAVNTVVTIWNIREGHKLRKLQNQLAKAQLDQIDQSKKDKNI